MSEVRVIAGKVVGHLGQALHSKFTKAAVGFAGVTLSVAACGGGHTDKLISGPGDVPSSMPNAAALTTALNKCLAQGTAFETQPVMPRYTGQTAVLPDGTKITLLESTYFAYQDGLTHQVQDYNTGVVAACNKKALVDFESTPNLGSYQSLVASSADMQGRNAALNKEDSANGQHQQFGSVLGTMASGDSKYLATNNQLLGLYYARGVEQTAGSSEYGVRQALFAYNQDTGNADNKKNLTKSMDAFAKSVFDAHKQLAQYGLQLDDSGSIAALDQKVDAGNIDPTAISDALNTVDGQLAVADSSLETQQANTEATVKTPVQSVESQMGLPTVTVPGAASRGMLA